MTNSKVALVAGLIDRSGSMQNVAEDTVGGTLALLEAQANLVKQGVLDTVYCYLAQFDDGVYKKSDGYDVLVDMEPLDWADLPDLSNYCPRGMTALYDSMHYMFDSIGKKLANMPEDERPGKVIIFINTDGQDNASKRYTAANIGDYIKEQEIKYNWEFMFLSSDLEAAKTASSVMKIKNTVSYDSYETKSTYGAASMSISRSLSV